MTPRFNWAYRYRGILMAPPYLFILLVFFGEWEQEHVIWPVGMSIFLVGVAVRVWAQIHLHYRLRVKKQLTTTGPYRFVRNPIYIANTTMLVGLTVISELVWFVPVMILWCAVVYSFVVRREESHLSDKYGTPYLEFMASTPRWVPSLVPLREARPITKGLLFPSLVAELHCSLLVFPFVGKEIVCHLWFH